MTLKPETIDTRWSTRDGRVLKVSEMTDAHIKNAMHMLKCAGETQETSPALMAMEYQVAYRRATNRKVRSASRLKPETRLIYAAIHKAEEGFTGLLECLGEASGRWGRLRCEDEFYLWAYEKPIDVIDLLEAAAIRAELSNQE